MLRSLRPSALVIGASALLALPTAFAAERIQVVTSFSILADMVQNVGGEHVAGVAHDRAAELGGDAPGDVA